MLSCCDADGEILSVPEFFAVGKTFRALFWCAVKGGGHCQFLNISVIYKVHLRRVPRPSVFINHLTLPKLMILHLVNCYLVCNGKTSKIGRHYLNTVKLSSLYDNTRCAIHPALRISAFYSILIIPYRLGIVVKII